MTPTDTKHRSSLMLWALTHIKLDRKQYVKRVREHRALRDRLRAESKARKDALKSAKAKLGNWDEQKAEMMRKLAESRYLQSGERIEFVDHDNQRRVYQPSKEIIRFKQQNDRSRKLFGWIKKQARNSIFLWAGVLVLSSAIGFFVPIDKFRNIKNNL